MSAIIISTILMLVAVNLSFIGFYSRFNVLDSETKERSSGLADACIDIALLGFAQNPSYSGDATTTIGADKCYIGPVSTPGSQKIFTTRGVFSNSYTNLKIKVDGTTFVVLSAEEMPNF